MGPVKLLKNPHLAPRTLRMPPVAVVDPLPMRADRRLHPVVDDLLRALGEAPWCTGTPWPVP